MSSKYINKVSVLFQWPYRLLLAISVISFIIYLASFVLLNNQHIRTWFSRLTAATFGSYLTAIVVDYSFREQERKEKERIKNIALQEFRSPLAAHLNLLTKWYTASRSEKPEEMPSSWGELFQDDFPETIENLDFSASAPAVKKQNWLAYSMDETQEFKQQINGISTKYGYTMDSDMTASFQRLENSMLFETLLGGGQKVRQMKERSGPEHVEKETKKMGGFVSDSIESHIDHLSEIMAYYEDSNAPDLPPFENTSIHNSNYAPAIGSARLDNAPSWAKELRDSNKDFKNE